MRGQISDSNLKLIPMWKRLVIISASAGAGAVLVLTAILFAFYWYSNRPKPWDNAAITAKLKESHAFDLSAGFVDESERKKAEGHYSICLNFDLTNNTMQDYELSIPSASMTPMELHSGSLLAAPGLKWSAGTGTLPYELPADFFNPKPALIPAHQTVRIDFCIEVAYSADIIRGKKPLEIAEHTLRDVDAFVLLDSSHHYRIELLLGQLKGTFK